MKSSRITKLITTSAIALTLAMPAGVALSQQQNGSVDSNLDQAGESFQKGFENTGEAVQEGYQQTETEVNQAAGAIEDKANWGWLGLLGLLGLFGLAGGSRKTRVVEHDHPGDRTTTLHSR